MKKYTKKEKIARFLSKISVSSINNCWVWTGSQYGNKYPKHLFLGTHKENMKDCLNKKRLFIQFGENHGRAILNNKQVKEIKKLYKPHVITRKYLANKYNVSVSTIENIIYKQNWKHL